VADRSGHCAVLLTGVKSDHRWCWCANHAGTISRYQYTG